MVCSRIKQNYLQVLNNHNKYSGNRASGLHGTLFGNTVKKPNPWCLYTSVRQRYITERTESA